jgi:hypothetical protein
MAQMQATIAEETARQTLTATTGAAETESTARTPSAARQRAPPPPRLAERNSRVAYRTPFLTFRPCG